MMITLFSILHDANGSTVFDAEDHAPRPKGDFTKHTLVINGGLIHAILYDTRVSGVETSKRFGEVGEVVDVDDTLITVGSLWSRLKPESGTVTAILHLIEETYTAQLAA